MAKDVLSHMSCAVFLECSRLVLLSPSSRSFMLQGWGRGDSGAGNMKRVFGEHEEEVRRVVLAERLLVFDVKEGWGPLCKLL